MVIAHDFFYEKVLSLPQALRLKQEKQDKAMILAGGTDLIVALKESPLSPELLIDLKGLDSLSLISEDEHYVRLGCNVTFSDICKSLIVAKECSILAEASQKVASKGVRNRATVVGNLCSAVPCMDSAPALLVLNALMVLTSVAGERRILLSDFLLAPRKVNLAPNELVTAIEIPKMVKSHQSIFIKLGRYQGEDLAQANLAIIKEITNAQQNVGEYRICFGSLSAVPVRVKEVESLLSNQILTPELIKKSKELVLNVIRPISDVRASKEYRIHMAQVMLERGLIAIEDRLKGVHVDSSTILGG